MCKYQILIIPETKEKFWKDKLKFVLFFSDYSCTISNNRGVNVYEGYILYDRDRR